MILLETTLGNIKITLDAEGVPNTAANFQAYVTAGFYDGLIFHRVIDGFMVQGGGFDASMTQKAPHLPAIQNEAAHGGRNQRGTLAMARTNDPHSATAQFFINVSDNDFLDYKNDSVSGFGYCVFGQVVEGMEVVDQIRAVKTHSAAGHQDVPVDPIVIKKAVVVSGDAE
jgi:peptidyl-prolyl cis-trans isomerase B (cyclophilin B)